MAHIFWLITWNYPWWPILGRLCKRDSTCRSRRMPLQCQYVYVQHQLDCLGNFYGNHNTNTRKNRPLRRAHRRSALMDGWCSRDTLWCCRRFEIGCFASFPIHLFIYCRVKVWIYTRNDALCLVFHWSLDLRKAANRSKILLVASAETG